MTATNRSLRNRLLIGASLATLTFAGTAHAQNFGARQTVDPSVAAAQAAQTAAQRNAQAEAAAQRTRASFEAASRVRAQMDAAQNAARQAALLAQTNIPNGLGAGGLQQAANIDIDPSLWVGANGPTQTTGENGRTAVTIDQTHEKAILTWETFNVGRETDLTFNQGSRDWIALNRVNDPNANPTQILGSINAEGSIYIINTNGVIFGGASQVNVRNLIASSLDINGTTLEARNQRFLDGLVPSSINHVPTFSDGVGGAESLPEEVFEAGDGVTVEAGAQITVADYGSAVLLGHNVVNNGTVVAPDGQVVLAAGRNIYLLNGLNRVALDNGNPTGTIRGYAVSNDRGGVAENNGLILAERGNITLNAKSIYQNGVLAATTAIDANGSIILDASVARPNVENVVIGAGRNMGEVVFGSGSHISILPDDGGRTLPGNIYQASQIEIYGNQILFEDNSTLYAPGANVFLISKGPNSNSLGNREAGRIYLGEGAVIDVSGLNGVEIDMGQNEIEAELRANELADNPVLRDSALRGETVYFDARLGEKLTDGSGVANLAGWYDLIERPVEQFMTTGGSVTLHSAEIITREGSLIDISGGSVQYLDGYVRRTQLIDPYGRLVPIEQALAGVNYVGVEGDFIVDHARWGVTERFENPFARISQGSWQAGYVEGRSAGTLGINTIPLNLSSEIYNNQTPDHARIFEGEVRGDVITGEYQVDAPTGSTITDVTAIWRERPALATLVWSANRDAWGNGAEALGGNITIADLEIRLPEDFASDTGLFDYTNGAASLVDGVVAHDHILPADWFDGATFGNVTLYSGDAVRGAYTLDEQGNLVLKEGSPPIGGVLTIGEGVTVDLGDYGAFNFIGRQAHIDGTILAPGGSVSLEAVWTPKLTGTASATLEETPVELRPGVTLGSTGVIDVAGRWSNNWLEALNGEALTAPVVDGGLVNIVAYKIALDEGSLIDVSGGAHLATDGTTLTLGDGGSILLDISQNYRNGTNAQFGVATGELELSGSLIGTAPGKGGTLTIDTPWDLVIGEDWGDLTVIADGVLEAGVAAPRDVVLTDALVILAGEPLPIDVVYTSTTVTPDTAFAAPSSLYFYDEANPVYIAADWIIPSGIQVYSFSETGAYVLHVPGTAVPAGTGLIYIDGIFGTGSSLPSSVFPNGLVSSRPATLLGEKGSVFATDFTIPAGTLFEKGTVLQQNALVDNDFKLVTPNYFQGGDTTAIADQWGEELAAIVDGVLEAGTAAPVNIRLSRPLTIAPGDLVPVDAYFSMNTLPPDTPLAEASNLTFYDEASYTDPANANPAIPQVDWTLPDGFEAYTPDGDYFGPGNVVPAGTRLYYISMWLPVGAVLPSAVFPDGLRLETPLTMLASAGSVATVAVTIPTGTMLDAGTVLASDASVYFPSRVEGSTFSHVGFANFGLSGSRGLTITAGSTIAPTVDSIALTGAVRNLATGAGLLDLAGVEGSGVALVNSADLPESLRQTTSLSLTTLIADISQPGASVRRRVSSDNSNEVTQSLSNRPGSLIFEEGADIVLSNGSTLLLDSYANLAIDGTISIPGGSIIIGANTTGSQIDIGETARLLAPGYVETLLTDGFEQRAVRAGGSVQIGSDAAYIDYTGSVSIDPGAVLDVSGIRGTADVATGDGGALLARSASPFAPVEVDGDAGSISITAGSGTIAGDLRLAPGGATGRGGSLTIYNPKNSSGIVVRQSLDPEVGSTGDLTLIADSVAASGLDTLVLKTYPVSGNTHGIAFDGNVELAARRSITLNASRVQRVADPDGVASAVTLSAAYVLFEGIEGGFVDSATASYATDLNGSLTVNADLIDITGWTNFDCTVSGCPTGELAYGGFGLIDLRSEGDIRLIGGISRGYQETTGLYRFGGFSTGGAVRFDAAQVYVQIGQLDTSAGGANERAEIDPGYLVRSGESITIVSNGNDAAVPLTYGERLTLRAPVIEQAGILRSPGGQLRLEAVDTVDAEGNAVAGTITLAPGSLTSTSLEGLTVPFGQVSTLTPGLFGLYSRADSSPTQSITLDGSAVDLREGSTVDVSGGGDLVGWSFESGVGGTQNLLSDSGYFAIVPSVGYSPMPNRTAANLTGTESTPFENSSLTVGDTIWLEGVPGLAAGYYTLLPAAYAVLDGALLVRPVSDSRQHATPVASVRRDDGSLVVSGHRAVAGTAIKDAFWSSFEVMDSDTWRQYSPVTLYSFNEQKAAASAEAGVIARTLADAGTLSIRTRDSLNLAGTALFGAEDGLLGNLDISATQIALAQAGSEVPEGYLFIDADQLEAFGAGSILIGGTRPRTTLQSAFDAALARSIAITTVASDVLVADGTAFSGSELLLVAKNSVTVGNNVVLTATGEATALDGRSLALTGNGALLRLSAADRVGLVRSGGSGTTGLLAIGTGSLLTTDGALSLDVSGGFDLAREAVLDVAQLDLASDRINLGSAPEGEAGTTIGTDTLERLAASADLLLRGHQSIVVFGDVALGSRGADGVAALQAVTFDTALLRGEGAASEGLTLTAGTLTLRNSGDTAASPNAGDGLLSIDVDTLALGPGATALGGFAALQGEAGTITTEGEGSLTVAGNLDLAAGSIVAGAGSDYAIGATGAVSVVQGDLAVVDQADTQLGGKLELSGSTVDLDTTVLARAGRIAIAATAGNLALGEHAVLDVSGASVDFIDVVKVAPGGTVLLAASGGISADTASLIDVSGAEEGGDAGTVEVAAGGDAALNGTLLASAAEGYEGGAFALDSATTDFSALNAALNAGGFTAARDIRLTGQDIVLAADETIAAHRVTLDAANGVVTIAGRIAANGSAENADGGVVSLTGRSVTLAATGRIDAAAGTVDEDDYDPASGSVTLAADDGRVVLASGSAIDLSGGREGGGRLTVRAARTATGADATLSGSVTGAREMILVGSTVYEAGTVDAALVSTVLADANGWLAGVAPVSGWDTGAGIVIRSAGDLTVVDDVDLAAISGPGYLGLDAAGELFIDANISDGFASAGSDAALQSGQSFSYGFTAGRDLRIGTLDTTDTVIEGRIVRTGTGDISLSAGGDLIFGNETALYTAGSATATQAGFDTSGYGTTKTSSTRVLGEFPTQGGSVSVATGGDIIAPIANRSVSAWLFRYGNSSWNGVAADTTVTDQTNWSVVYRNFNSGIGALGGGNVRVRAGGDIQDLTVAIPTTGHLTTAVGSHATADDLVIRGGGDLDVYAGGNLLGGFYMLGRGEAELQAAGLIGEGAVTRVITANINSAFNPTTVSRGLNPLVALMDAMATFTAGGDVTVEGAYDPTMSPQICENVVGTCTTTATTNTIGGTGSAFVGYSERSALGIVSLGGDATYQNNGFAGTAVSRWNEDLAWQIKPVPVTAQGQTSIAATAQVAPGILRIAALSGDVMLTPALSDSGVSTDLRLASAPQGTFEALAAGDLFNGHGSNTGGSIVLENYGVEYIRSALAPRQSNGATVLPADFYSNPGNNNYRGMTPLHAGDAEPVRLIALNGSIVHPLYETNTSVSWTLNSPKPVFVYAGEDIWQPSLQIQHNDDSGVSRLIAGRDFGLYSSIQILGEGLLWIEAGRDYSSTGSVQSVGNGSAVTGSTFVNLAMPDRSADIVIAAGTAQGSAYDTFAALYLDPENLADPDFGLSHPTNDGKVVHTYEEELEEWLADQGFTGVNAENRLSLFSSLAPERQKAFLQQVLFTELRETGIDYNDADGPRFQQYTRGYSALHTLFPATAELESRDNPAGGNISLNNGLIATRSNGNITLLAPYGRVDIGNLQLEIPIYATPGVITSRGGEINIVANGTIALGASRAFTLGGGDLLMWTSYGDITAGVGSKTSVRSAALTYQMDVDGAVSLNNFGLSTGAGIGVLDAFQGEDEDREASRLDLLAFFGEVNAGDAGIRVIGDLNIAALRVVNAANIEVSGEAVGIPQVAAVNVGALNAASSATSAIVNEAAQLAERNRPQPVRDIPSIITGRLLGFGE